MNRKDLRRLANSRLREAKRLLKAKSYSGAYYLAGLGVECAIKACIAKLTKQHEFPDKKLADECFKHNFIELIKAARILDKLKAECANNAQFDANWAIVAKWSINSRYEPKRSKKDAREMYLAIVSTKNGVLKWLRERW